MVETVGTPFGTKYVVEGILETPREGSVGLITIWIVLTGEDGTPVYLKDVANVRIGARTRQGVVTKDGEGEAVIGMAIMLKGSNSKLVVDRVKEEIVDDLGLDDLVAVLDKHRYNIVCFGGDGRFLGEFGGKASAVDERDGNREVIGIDSGDGAAIHLARLVRPQRRHHGIYIALQRFDVRQDLQVSGTGVRRTDGARRCSGCDSCIWAGGTAAKW